MKKMLRRILSFIMLVCMAFMGVFTMPFVSANAEAAWTLVTDVNDLAVGDQVVIAAMESDFAMQAQSSNGNNWTQVGITKSGNTIEVGSAKQFTLESGTVDNTFAFNTGSGYLCAASSSSNHLKTKSTKDANASWKISIAAGGVASVVAQGSYTRNTMKYNKSSSLFSCYKSSNTMQDMCLYKLSEGESGGSGSTEPSTPIPSISLSGDNNMKVGGTVTLTANTDNVTGSVAWSSSDTSVATVANGAVTGLAIGTATITASVDGVEATKVVKVYPVENSTLTIAEALKVCEMTGTTETTDSYSAKGTIKSIDYPYNVDDEDRENITVTITDGTDSIKAYKMAGGQDLVVGFEIVVTGNLVTYGTTKEFNTGCTYTLAPAMSTIGSALNNVEASMSLAYKYTATTEEVEVAASAEVTDTLNRAFTGIEGTNYGEWSNNGTSTVEYKGQSAGGNDAIQLRSNNSNSGIVTTTSVGKVKKIVVAWNSNTTAERTLDVYVKNTAYTAATDLYNSETQGTKIGSIVNGTSTELVLEDDYAFIGIRSKSGALYLDEVNIIWESENASSGETVTKVETTYSDSQFQIRCGVDASVASIAGVDAYGIEITAGGKTQTYTGNLEEGVTEDGEAIYYVVINLGDIINETAKLGTEFTVKAYVEVDGVTYTSTSYKTHSVASMVKHYYKDLNIEEVAHLYNYLFN